MFMLAYPGDKVGRVLVLEVPDSIFDVSHAQLASVSDRDGQVLAESWVDSSQKGFSLEQSSGQSSHVGGLGKSAWSLYRSDHIDVR